MNTLIPGQNCRLTSRELSFRVSAARPADFSAYVLDENGKTSKDEDFLFYGNKSNLDNTVTLVAEVEKASFFLDLNNMNPLDKKVLFAVTAEEGLISGLGVINFELKESGGASVSGCIDCTGRKEGALIIGEVYRHKGAWKYRFVAQGFNFGLKSLAEYYGVEIAEEAPAIKDTPSLGGREAQSRIILNSEEPKINLEKKDAPGSISKIKLMQIQNHQESPSAGAMTGRSPRLELAAYVELKDGEGFIVQALGNSYGDLDYPPYVKLLRDNRARSGREGECLAINNRYMEEIAEIIVFTFVYDGLASWNEDRDKVEIHIEGHPPVETHMGGGSKSLPLCAAARIKNDSNALSIERVNRYFRGHKDMDKAYGWGFDWIPARG